MFENEEVNQSHTGSHVDDKCIEQNAIDNKRWVIDAVVNALETKTSNEITMELSNISGVIDCDDMAIGIEFNEGGKIHRIIAYVENEKQAEIMSEAMKTFCDNASHDRECEEPIIRETTQELSLLSSGHFYHVPITAMVLMIAMAVNCLHSHDRI